ncbi:hypothetical protein ACFPL7_13000 [Dongia soli]|uniref:Uncharacterized protein n=1 Tax=Dongia soli TaxID=600628 RepID=A0ABU5EF86_9PROT|nr:hypothetical protein [Dongia soli]MDY0885016.1 hypothetical protein [Dongia soli]
MGRREDERKALDIVAGRMGRKQAAPAKPQMSGVAMLSIWLWVAAIVVIGGIVYYVYVMK